MGITGGPCSDRPSEGSLKIFREKISKIPPQAANNGVERKKVAQWLQSAFSNCWLSLRSWARWWLPSSWRCSLPYGVRVVPKQETLTCSPVRTVELRSPTAPAPVLAAARRLAVNRPARASRGFHRLLAQESRSVNVSILFILLVLAGLGLLVVLVTVVATLAARRSGNYQGGNPNLCPCPDCGRLISIRASVCPHCGGPIKAL